MHSAAIVIPTTGAPLVRKSIESALAQTYANTKIFIVIDGPEFAQAFANATQGLDLSACLISTLPANVGRNGFYGHRVYAAYSHLIDADYISFLDQDNWFDPDHIATLVARIEQQGVDWAFALRKVVNEEGDFLTKDESQSVGPWGQTGPHKLVDTNCYCLRMEVAHRIASHWHGGWGQDRVFYAALIQAFPRFACTGAYTVNYRTRPETQGAVLALLARENLAMRMRYPEGFPWMTEASAVAVEPGLT